jgi:polyribonucleotide nucleotidyltransferase
MEKKFTLPELGYEAVLGKFAQQADGAVMMQRGGTVVLAAVVSEASKDFPGFFPLSVDYKEHFSSVGKIPGGYFKREGKPTDKEVLNARIIDRNIRPLFPANYFNKVVVTGIVYSVDKNHMPGPLCHLAVSLALSTSKIPFMGPVGVCEVARVNGAWVTEPSFEQSQASDVRLLVAGNEEGVNMVEGSSVGMTEEELVEAMFLGHEVIKKQIAWQHSIVAEYGAPVKEKAESFDLSLWEARARAYLTPERIRGIFVADKVARGNYQSDLRAGFFELCKEDLIAKNVSDSFVGYSYDAVLQEALTEMIFALGHRVDGRSFKAVREISSEVGLTPSTHGSALFTRGRTQLLTTATLGSGEDESRIETLLDEPDNPFMLHYNFPPFSVGEARPMRAPGRREVGHGHLAASSLKAILPEKEAFPYTIRLVADTLESDGSSSMATVCSSVLALMDAGVPIKSMVSGIAMGLLMNRAGEICVLTDLTGIEDAFGLMDFKVAGTDTAITAIQMDIKYKGGFSRDVFIKSLAQAKEGRAHIMNEMRKTMSAPREEMSGMVPRFETFKIAREKIGAVIGSGGKVIREIIEKTGTKIDIEDDGLVKIFGQPGPLLEQAVNWVKMLGGQVPVGSILQGRVRGIPEFGYFVELVPGVDGLVHISTVPRSEQEAFKKRYREGDKVSVHVLDYDPVNGRIRLKIVE